MKNKITKAFIFAFLMSLSLFIQAQGIIINHTCTNMGQVPDEWVNQAKSEFKIWYGHTSHGSQVTSGIENLQSHIGAPYTLNYSGTGGALSYQEIGWADLGHNGDLYWEQLTRQQLNSPGNDRNVVMWSWCGGVSDNSVAGINIYLNAMNQLELDYPNVTFIYMTGHLDIWSWANLKARNQQIRDYCIANNKILFDFADIESYNPDGTFFNYASDDCSYWQGAGWGYLGNWAQEWCAAHPGSDLCWNCDCAHSESLNCNLKGRAFWWMMAKMAGWGEEQTTFYVDKNNPAASDANPGTESEPWLTIQHAANVLNPGDSVLIRDGIYHESVTTQNDGNEMDGHIVFMAYPGEHPVIDGQGVNANAGFYLQNSYIKLINIEIRDWQHTGIWIEDASFFEIIGCEIHEMIFGVGISGNSHDFLLRDVIVHHFDYYGIDASPMGENFCYNGTFINCVSHTGRDPEQNVDGFALGHGQQHNFVFDHCTAYEVYDGFDISAASTLLNGCTSYSCYNGCYKLWQDQIELVNCVGYNSFSIVQLAYNGTASETILRNCTFYDSEVFTIWVGDSNKTFQMHNCIISGGENIGLCFEQPYFSNYTGDNNLFQNIGWRAIAVGYSTEITIDDIETGVWTAYSGQDANSVTAGNAGEIFLNPAIHDLHLRIGSPAVNNANIAFSPTVDFDGNPRPYGVFPDIGSFELQENLPFYAVNPTSVNFGNVFIGESQTREITITNESEIPVVIDNIEVQQGVFQLPEHSFPIEINDTFTFDIIFEPLEVQNYTGAITVYSSQTFNATVTLTGNGIEEPISGFHVSGDVSGLWQNYDTIYVDGDIVVQNGETLTVTPVPGGTEIIFTGPFSVTVYGKLLLTGNETDSIRFYAEDAGTGWEGIRFINTSGNNQGNSEIQFCLFKDGRNLTKADGSGGAIQADYSSNLVITNSRFLNNEATNGGAIYLDFSSPSITDCEISFNTAQESGGGIFIGYDCNPELSNLNIHHNSALSGNGGGVYILYGSAPNFQNSSIKSNIGYSGGGIACSSDLAVFSYVEISGNTANGEWAGGGGISCSANPLISHCTIKGNISNGTGGGISCNYENSPRIEYCEIEDNQAASGGGIACLYSSNPNIKHTFFRNNQALNGNGGGMYNWAGSSPELAFVSFESNSASDEGGAIYIQDSDGKFTNLTIKNNQATSKGGGIYVRGSSSPEFFNAQVTGNSSGWGGGIIFFENTGSPVLHNFTISENTASISGGGVACDVGNPVFYSSVFWENEAAEAGQNVYLHVPESAPYFNYCLVGNGIAGFGGDGAGQNYDVSRYLNNREDNPQFANSAESDFTLLVSSPAINHGVYDTTGFSLPATDLNGNPRYSAYLLDVGCYENQEFIAPQQTLTLPSGWSGISSYLLPYFPRLEKMMEPANENLIILQNLEGVFWPSQNANTLGNWNTEKGYLIKLSQEENLTIPGTLIENIGINLPSGWSLIPVLNSCGLQTDELISQFGSSLIFIKEAVGIKVYWPEMGVQSLTDLMPGNSYFIFLNEPVLLTFPACDK